jgi:hypothetical protein
MKSSMGEEPSWPNHLFEGSPLDAVTMAIKFQQNVARDIQTKAGAS